MKKATVRIERVSPDHINAIIENRGRCVFSRYAAKEGQEPTAQEVLEDYENYKGTKDAFTPYYGA